MKRDKSFPSVVVSIVDVVNDRVVVNDRDVVNGCDVVNGRDVVGFVFGTG